MVHSWLLTRSGVVCAYTLKAIKQNFKHKILKTSTKYSDISKLTSIFADSQYLLYKSIYTRVKEIYQLNITVTVKKQTHR